MILKKTKLFTAVTERHVGLVITTVHNLITVEVNNLSK